MSPQNFHFFFNAHTPSSTHMHINPRSHHILCPLCVYALQLSNYNLPNSSSYALYLHSQYTFSITEWLSSLTPVLLNYLIQIRETLSSLVLNSTQAQSPRTLSPTDSPVCRTGQRWEYGIARDEMVHVSCQVDAHPKHVSFSWKFNNSAQTTDITEAHITNNFTFSQVSLLNYVPVNNKVRLE